jgi:hypothetical protein
MLLEVCMVGSVCSADLGVMYRLNQDSCNISVLELRLVPYQYACAGRGVARCHFVASCSALRADWLPWW